MADNLSRQTHRIVRIRNGKPASEDDLLAVEEPLEIRLHCIDINKGPVHRTLSITMRTPGHDQELALGFLFSEGLLPGLEAVDSTTQVNPNVVQVNLKDTVRLDLGRLERHFYTTSSCGICGKASLEALSVEGAEAIHDNRFTVRLDDLLALPEALRRHQPLFSATGGNHGVALFDQDCRILATREDVGRHNAMDKLIGHSLLQGQLPLSNTGILVSGRASFELMQKALMAGYPMLAAVGAPSSLAVELAEEFNITLVGFLGDRGCNVYHGNAPVS